jgi:hypothetical protein
MIGRGRELSNSCDSNYIPEKVPCGRKINQDWEPGKQIECCRTLCPYKDTPEIESCSKIRGRITGGGRFHN